MSANQPAGVIITRFADGRDAFWLPLSRTEREGTKAVADHIYLSTVETLIMLK